ncbi:MAG: hypothetical protein GY788_31655, partial [bacterium]|nr:hypothetical protein [bacterium]
TIFVQPDHDTAVAQLRAVVDQLQGIAPTVAEKLQAMEADLLAYTGYANLIWPRLGSFRSFDLAPPVCVDSYSR